MADKIADGGRIASLDQFRGYTVLGMFLVNFVGSYAAIKATLPVLGHHNTYCSYADTIMPQFFFAVGFAYRLTFLKRRETQGARAAYAHTIKRSLGLFLLAFVVYHLDGRYATWTKLQELGVEGFFRTAFTRTYFQTLAHIAATTLWIMPAIALRPSLRVLYALFSTGLFLLLSDAWYYEWVMHRPGIDGGVLGFMSWTIPTIAGTLAFDAMQKTGPRPVGRLVAAAGLLMLLGYGISCLNLVTPPNSVPAEAGWQARLIEPPFVPPTRPVNTWTMCQRSGSVSYMTFGAGFSLAVYALFVLACDVGSLRVGIFRTLGSNALAGYIIHGMVNDAVQPFVPRDSPLWYVFAGFGVSLAICYLFLRFLEKQRLFLKL